jgi:hypothetical protein
MQRREAKGSLESDERRALKIQPFCPLTGKNRRLQQLHQFIDLNEKVDRHLELRTEKQKSTGAGSEIGQQQAGRSAITAVIRT